MQCRTGSWCCVVVNSVRYQAAVCGLLSSSFAACATAGRPHSVGLCRLAAIMMIASNKVAAACLLLRLRCCSPTKQHIAHCSTSSPYQCRWGTCCSSMTAGLCACACVLQVSHGACDEVLVTGGYDTAVKVWDCRSWSQEPIQTMRQCKVGTRIARHKGGPAQGNGQCAAGWLW